jgi:DNA-binding MarR family transcriptional regulator
MNNLIKPLTNLGLTEKEAQVYLALLELERASVQEIARKSKVHRSTCYVALESLREYGFVDVSADKAVREYLPASPLTILKHARNITEKHNGILGEIEELTPKLLAIKKDQTEKPEIKIYKGVAAVERSQFEMLEGKKGSPFRVFEATSDDDYYKRHPKMTEEECEFRTKNKNKMHWLGPDTPVNAYGEKVFTSLTPDDHFILCDDPALYKKGTAAVWLCGNTVIFYGGDYSISITNKSITDTLNSMFDFSWRLMGGEEIKDK